MCCGPGQFTSVDLRDASILIPIISLQARPLFCLPRPPFPIQSTPLWPVCPMGVHQLCGSSSLLPTVAGHEGPPISFSTSSERPGGCFVFPYLLSKLATAETSKGGSTTSTGTASGTGRGDSRCLSSAPCSVPKKGEVINATGLAHLPYFGLLFDCHDQCLPLRLKHNLA